MPIKKPKQKKKLKIPKNLEERGFREETTPEGQQYVRETRLGKVIPPAPYSVTLSSGETLFGERARTVPKSILEAPGTKVVSMEEAARQRTLTPEQRMKEQKEIDFQKGLQTGDFGALLTEEDLNARLAERGQIPFQEPIPEEPRPLVEKIAGVGVAVPVTVANIISKGLGFIGVDIGEVSIEEFASRDVGKVLGIATAAAATVMAGAGIYLGAAALFPAIGAKVVGTAAVGKVAAATATVKTSAFASLTSSKLMKTLFVGGIVVSTVNARISDLETSVVNQRETLTLISSMVDVGAITPAESLIMFNDLESSMNASDRAIQNTALVSYKSWLGKGKEVQTRLEKARSQLIVERTKSMNLLTQPPQTQPELPLQ